MHVQSGSLLEAALRYAELGYPVFPCAPGTKRPLTKNGFHDATKDAGQVERWWSARPNANIGVATQGLLVVDVDSSDNPWLADDPDKQVELASSALSLTANGGRHYIFRQPDGRNWRGTSGALAERVDTRADGGYIVVPPSVLQGGKAYRWAPGLELDVPPASLPEPPAWLAAELDRLATSGPTSARVAADDASANKIPSGQRNATLARLGGAMRRVGMSQAEILAALVRANADRCDPPLEQREVERIAASVARYEPDQVSVALVENHWEQLCQPPPEETKQPDPEDPGPTPDELLDVPGFIHDVMEYTLTNAPYPDRALAFAGALSLQALLAGRKVRDAGDNRTNLYVVALANSGAGKDFPRKTNEKILLHAGMAECLGDEIGSAEGMLDDLELTPSLLFQTDEIDFLMQAMNQPKESRYQRIMQALLKLFTSANGLYVKRKKVGKQRGYIDQPSVCLFGTAIPEIFYKALSLKMLTNGWFARLLILEAPRRGEGRGDDSVADIPSGVLETAEWWSRFQPGRQGNLQEFHPQPRRVEATPKALRRFRDFQRASESEYRVGEERGSQAHMALWARAVEKARKLALVYACSENHEGAEIDESAADWACRLVAHQTRRMLFMAGLHISESDFEAKCKRVLEVLHQWREQHGDMWMPFRDLSRKLRWSKREHDEIRATLLDQELIQYDSAKTAGRARQVYRLPP